MHWARLEFSANRSAFANALAVRHKVGFNPFFMLGIILNSATPYHRILQRNLHNVLLFRIVRGNVLVARATTNRAANTFRVPTRSFYRNLTRATHSLRVAFRRGLSLQESAEIIQLINHSSTLFNLSHFFKECDPRFSTCEKQSRLNLFLSLILFNSKLLRVFTHLSYFQPLAGISIGSFTALSSFPILCKKQEDV